MTTTLDDYLDDDCNDSSNSSSNDSSGSEPKTSPSTKLSKSERDQYDYENPIEAFQRKGLDGSPLG